MRIVHLNRLSPPAGGVETHLGRLGAALTRAGHVSLGLVGSGRAPIGWRVLPHYARFRTFGSPGAVRDALRILREMRPDVVMIHEMDAFDLAEAILARFPAVKFAHMDFCCAADGRRYLRAEHAACRRRLSLRCLLEYYVRGCAPSRDPRFAVGAFLRARRALRTWRRAPRVLTASEFVRASLVEHGLAPERLDVLPYFVPAPEEPPPYPADLDRVVLFVGRIVEGKGLGQLLGAMGALASAEGRAPARLVVAGDGVAREAAERESERMGLTERVRFLGWDTDPSILYARARVVVVPSLWPEPFGIVGLEAMAAARPVVAYRSGGIPEWLDDGVTGRLVEPRDITGLARTIGLLLDDPDTAARMGRAGHARVRERFGEKGHVEALLGHLKRAINTFVGVRRASP